MIVGVFGLGEAGSLIAADLAAAGAEVHAYDPAVVATPAGVVRHDDPAAAVRSADLILAVTAAADAPQALAQALDDIGRGTVYADLATGSAGLKQSLAATATERGVDFVDVALMSTVPGKGLGTPVLASGPGSGRFTAMVAPMGMPVQDIGGAAGTAATRKLLRSVVLKGLAGVVIEAMVASEAAGLAAETWENLADQFDTIDAAFLRRMVTGTGQHVERRLHEMEAAEALLEDLGIEPVMTRATVSSLRRLLADGAGRLPDLP